MAGESYVERKIALIVEAAKEWCGKSSTPRNTRHEIALDAMKVCGDIFRSGFPTGRAKQTNAKLAELLSVFPIFKKDANGLFREQLDEMEDVLVQFEVQARKVQQNC